MVRRLALGTLLVPVVYRTGMRDSNTLPAGPKCSILDLHLERLHAHLIDGCENAMKPRRELREVGFSGTGKQVRR